MPYPKSCQRKLTNLTTLSEERTTDPRSGHTSIIRSVSATVELEVMLTKLREVKAACFPDRGFVRLKVANYYDRFGPPEQYPLVAFDTNAHGYDWRGRHSVARLKSGASYRRPSPSLCEPGHVGICWGYQGQDGTSLFASLASGAVAEALKELEEMHGARPENIEVRVQMVLLKPDAEHSKRTFMSWGAA